jgi:hypothetical protein
LQNGKAESESVPRRARFGIALVLARIVHRKHGLGHTKDVCVSHGTAAHFRATDEKQHEEEPHDLNELLDVIEGVADENSKVSFRKLYDAIGHRSFGPLLLLAGLVVVMPVVGDIPGVPTVMGAIVVLIAGQMLARRKQFWLPRRLLDVSLAAPKVCKGVRWLRKPARFVDKGVRRRLTQFVTAPWTYVIASIALIIGLAQPFMELVPFSANGAGAALTAFGLALIARDGLVALVAMAVALLTGGVVAYALLA